MFDYFGYFEEVSKQLGLPMFPVDTRGQRKFKELEKENQELKIELQKALVYRAEELIEESK